MAVLVVIILSIVGLFCSGALASGLTGFWLWLFALGSEIFTLFCIGCVFSESKNDSDSTTPEILNVIGTLFWGIGLTLLFADVESRVWALFCVACLFIAPYFIMASLDALFSDSTVAMVLVGIVKVASSIFAYTGGLKSLEHASAGIPGKSIAYIAILLLLVLLFWLQVIPRKIITSNKERRERRIREKESKRKQTKEKYSYQLITAVEKSDIKTVISLLEKGADVNYKDFSGKIPLKIAIKNNDKNIISLLLERGANIEYKDRYGCTPLLNAVENGNVDMASFLLDKGANINCCDSRSRTALDLAIEKEDVELISFLLERGADIGDSESSLKAALDFAIKNDNADILSFLAEQAVHKDVYIEDKPFLFFAMENDYKKLVELLIEKGANIECRGKYENTPLLIAAHDGNLALVSLLVEHGANIECENEDKFTPLSAAAAKGSLDTVSFLLEKGANVEHEDKNGSTPLEYAAIVGKNKEIVSLLIEHGADIEHKDKNGVTPLDRAIDGENKEFISILLEKGANVNYISKIYDTETTPLLSAVTRKNEEIVSLLLEKGADVNLATTNEFTVLQQAICDRSKNIVSILLDAGADVNKNSDKIETSLIDAVDKENYDPEIVSLLIERGADVNLESAFHGHTPLISAVSQNNKDAVLLLLKNGADPNKKSSKLGSPLMIAFQAVNKEMCALLMENDANPCEVLCVAAMMQNTEVAQFFLERGADVNCRGIGDKTPLMHAISFSTKEMVLFLISNGADVNLEMSEPSEKNSPRTPLEAAIVSGKAEMLSLLITYGADVNYETKNGNTPLLFAALHKQIKLVPILKEAGAVSVVSAKTVQPSVKMSKATTDSQNDAADFNAALVSLSKIIAKNGAEILSSENNQKLKALVSDLIPQENEIASKLKQALSCDFTQIILDSDGKSDSKKEKAFKDAVDKVITKTKLKKDIAISIVRLVALSLDWNLENLNME